MQAEISALAFKSLHICIRRHTLAWCRFNQSNAICRMKSEGWLQSLTNCLLPWLYTLTGYSWSISLCYLSTFIRKCHNQLYDLHNLMMMHSVTIKNNSGWEWSEKLIEQYRVFFLCQLLKKTPAQIIQLDIGNKQPSDISQTQLFIVQRQSEMPHASKAAISCVLADPETKPTRWFHCLHHLSLWDCPESCSFETQIVCKQRSTRGHVYFRNKIDGEI